MVKLHGDLVDMFYFADYIVVIEKIKKEGKPIVMLEEMEITLGRKHSMKINWKKQDFTGRQESRRGM